MIKKNKPLPGDIARVVRKVNNQDVTVYIKGEEKKLKRLQYDKLMKCTLFNSNEAKIPSGFYLVDSKARTASFVMPLTLATSDVEIKVNDVGFKVERLWRGFNYGEK